MDYNPRVILVFSNCISVIDAKLTVYKKYTDAKRLPDNFFIHHEYDDTFEISKWSAFCKASFICDKINSMTHSNPNSLVFNAVYQEVSKLPRTTIVGLCVQCAVKHSELQIWQKGHGHSETNISQLVKMLLEEVIKMTCKVLGLKIFIALTSSSVQQFPSETIPYEIYDKMVFEAMKLHVISEYDAKFGFTEHAIDVPFGRTIRKIGDNIYHLIREKQRDIASTFMRTYCKTMENIKNVSLTLENLQKKCRPTNMSECK